MEHNRTKYIDTTKPRETQKSKKENNNLHIISNMENKKTARLCQKQATVFSNVVSPSRRPWADRYYYKCGRSTSSPGWGESSIYHVYYRIHYRCTKWKCWMTDVQGSTKNTIAENVFVAGVPAGSVTRRADTSDNTMQYNSTTCQTKPP